MKKLMIVTTTVYGGSGIKSRSVERKLVDSTYGHSRPAYAAHGTHRCGGLPTLRRTEKFYSKLEWEMKHGGR